MRKWRGKYKHISVGVGIIGLVISIIGLWFMIMGCYNVNMEWYMSGQLCSHIGIFTYAISAIAYVINRNKY